MNVDEKHKTIDINTISEWLNFRIDNGPIQIIHNIPEEKANMEGMSYYKNLGLGGIVCNISFDNYMLSEKNWENLTKGIKNSQELGLHVWIYDEEGYPSGAAGGLVLKANPSHEALAMTYDEAGEKQIFIRWAYEHTHATNNFYAKRRYINLLDAGAVESFIEQTHKRYLKRFQKFFGNTIEAFFTDEPSLIAINLGYLPYDVKEKIRVIDPDDPQIKPLPCIPWSSALENEYYIKWGENLMDNIHSLFKGNSEKDKIIRRQFWSLISDLVSKNYFAKIRNWCRQHSVLSSGHTLFEEQLVNHIALYGNSLKCLCEMDIPGLDMLSSNPGDVSKYGWLTAGFPCSAAYLNGTRRVMTEVSDFEQKMSNEGPANLKAMMATAAWQASWGITDFALYYNIEDRSPEEHKKYCQFINRINSILINAKPIKKTLLYYPITDLWEEYIPIANKLTLDTQSERMQMIISSFMKLGKLLQKSQIPFVIIDPEHLDNSILEEDGLKIGENIFDSILIPQEVNLQPKIKNLFEEFRNKGGNVIFDDASITSTYSLLEILQPEYRILLNNGNIAFGIFTRDEHAILLFVNTAETTYAGVIQSKIKGDCTFMEPENGSIYPAEFDELGNIILELLPRQTKILIV
jgi:hypothetical protein